MKTLLNNKPLSKMKTMKMKNLYLLLCICLCVGYSLSVTAQVQYVNLLQNPGTSVDTSGWTLTYDDGSGHVFLPTGGFDGTGAIQGGYETIFEQEVDLIAVGYTAADLDNAPIVRYSDWIAGSGPDSIDFYIFRVSLLDGNDNVIVEYDSYNDVGFIPTNGVIWSQNTHSFVNYGPGLRKIKVVRSGLDGEYNQTQTVGTKMDAACLVVGNHLMYASNRTHDLAGWNVTANGGDGWNANSAISLGYQTSYNTCTKSQTVNLLDLGYTAAELDQQPKVSLWEFFLGFDGTGNGSGIGDFHNLKAELRDGSGNVLASYDSGSITGTAQWQQIGNVFENYGVGLREIFVEHSGYDQEYWNGHYGGFVDATQVTLEFLVSTDVEEMTEEANTFTVYPNPVAANEPIAISIDNEFSGQFNLDVTDMLGRSVFQTTFEKSAGNFQTSFVPGDLPQGIYQISIKRDGFITTQRVSIQ